MKETLSTIVNVQLTFIMFILYHLCLTQDNIAKKPIQVNVYETYPPPVVAMIHFWSGQRHTE